MYKSKAFFFTVFIVYCGSMFSQGISLNVTEEAAIFQEERDTVLVYQIQPKSLKGNYKRANYIHPLFSLDGVSITEDFPDDHLHHRGIFWAWHQLYINGKRIGDGWEIRDFEWHVLKAVEVKKRNGWITLESQIHWESGLHVDENGDRLPFVKETNWITVYPKKDNYRVVDIKIQLYPLFDDISIGGSEDEKGYGGFSTRVQLSQDVEFKDSERNINPRNTPVQGNNWINIVSKTSENNKPYGLAIIPSKENPSYPNPWILRSRASMQNAVYPYPGAKPVTLSNEKPLILKYRLVVHDGAINNTALFEIQQDFFNSKE